MEGRRRGEAKSSIKGCFCPLLARLKVHRSKSRVQGKVKGEGLMARSSPASSLKKDIHRKRPLELHTEKKRKRSRIEHLLVALSKEMAVRGKDTGLHREVQKSQPPSSHGTAGDVWEATGRSKASALVSACHFSLANHNW